MSPFEVAKNINKKDGVLDDLKGLEVFILTKIFSNTRDTVLIANEANKWRDMKPEMVYRFFYHAIPKSKSRYGEWNKKIAPTEDIELIMEIYGYSRKKAEDVAPLFPDIKILRELAYKGGTKK